MSAIARRRHVVLLAAATLVLVTGCFGRSEVTVLNRTTQDIVVQFGFQFGEAVLVPACGEVSFHPSDRPEVPSPPPSAIELQVALNLPPDAVSTSTLTITSEQVWTYPFPSPPPCEGLAPVSSPTPGSTGG